MSYLLVVEELVPLGLLADELLPPGVVVELAAEPLGLDDMAPVPDVLPVPPGVVVVELDVLDPGLLGAVVVVDEDDDPPGTTTVSFSFVVVLEVPAGPDPPGTTVVFVSLRSHAESASAPTSTNT